ncbi:MAG TPA: MobA/MobL family protein [Steroidobacteraceae bacterium]
MAVYFLRSKHISRSNGSRVTRAAAYRAGERIRNEATSEVFDFSSRRDIPYKEIVLPADLVDRVDMAWTQDRGTLWNAAEHAGLRCNSRLAREWLVFLPPELTPDQRHQLVRDFARELADRYRAAVDVCVHEPRAGADPRNHHAHLLMTTREVTPDGLGARTGLEVSGRQRYLMGIPGSSRDEYLSCRARWAELTNEALERAGLSQRIDHRSLKDRGLDREPTLTIPEKVWYAERAGRFSAAGNEIRARHRERLNARSLGPEALASVIEKQRTQIRAQIERERQRQPKKTPYGSLTREERNAYRREYYRKRRELEAQNPAATEKRRAAGRRAYHLQMQKNPESIREGRRRYRAENAADLNRKQREYRRKNAAALNEKRREQRKAKAIELTRSTQPRITKASDNEAHAAAMRWKSNYAQHETGRTASEAAQRWKALYAEHETGRTAGEAAQRWKALYAEHETGRTAREAAQRGKKFTTSRRSANPPPTRVRIPRNATPLTQPVRALLDGSRILNARGSL